MRLKLAWFCLMAIAVLPSFVFALDNSARLKTALEGKSVLLRDYFEGDSLEYDSAGKVLGSPRSGTWVSDAALEIEKISLTQRKEAQMLTIEAKRAIQFYKQDGTAVAVASPRRVRIKVSFPPTADEVQISEAIERVFYKPGEAPPPPPAPPYTASRSLDGRYERCELPEKENAHLLTPNIPMGWRLAGSAECTAHLPEPIAIGRFSGEEVYIALPRDAKEFVPPRVLKDHPNPEFTSAALKTRVAGAVVTSLVLDKEGRVVSMKLEAKPLGYGLDENAVAAITKWKFRPATLNGDPVFTVFCIEVNFRRY